MKLLKLYYIIFIFLVPVCKTVAQDAYRVTKLKTSLKYAKDENIQLPVLHKLCIQYFNINYDSCIYFGKLAIEIANRLHINNEITAGCYYWVGYALEKKERYAESLNYLLQAQLFYKKNSNTKKLALAEEELSVTCYYLAKFNEALQYAESALSGYEKIKSDTGKIEILTHLGYIYQSRLNPTMALKCLSLSLNIAEKTHHKYYQSANLIAIGLFYVERKEFEQAKIYYDKSVLLLDKINDKILLAKYNSVLGLINTQLKNYDEATKDLDDAIATLSAAKDYNALCYAYQNKAALYNTLNQSQKALQYDLLSLQAFVHTTNEEGIADQYYNIGITYMLLHKTDSALLYIKKGLMMAEEKHFAAIEQKSSDKLAGLYALSGEYKTAYLYKKNYELVKDSLDIENNKNNLTEFQTQFETERKEKEITLLKKDQQLNQASLQKQKIFQYAAFIIFFLLILIGFLIINRYRSVQRAKRLIEMEKIRNDISRNLHDDIGSTLTSINVLSKVALQQTENAVTKTSLQKIKNRSAEIMESMSDIVWAINSANDALDKIILRMKEFATETLEQAGIGSVFNEEGIFTDIKLSPAARNNLYMIFKEALNNIVKYSEAESAFILIKKEQKNLFLKISDNGKGFNIQQQVSGNGLKNMQSRAAEMNAKIQFQSNSAEGTTIKLFVPIT